MQSHSQQPLKETIIKGVYAHPKPFWDKNMRLDSLGVNAVFIRSWAINKQTIKRARSEGLLVFAEFATLLGKNYVDKHPEAWAINEKGEKVKPASWFMGVCPTEPGFRKYRFDQLKVLLQKYEIDGVWMDYVHWHAQFEDPEPILPETCFCKHCLSSFSKEAKVELPEGSIAEKAQWILKNQDKSWREWRCEVIYDWTKEIKNILKKIRPNAILGLYHCPWNNEEFDGSRYRILGLDFDLLKKTVDVFSPMVYHAKMGRKPGWVKRYTNWLSEQLELSENTYSKIWPIVQAYNDPYMISAEEFETVLVNGLSGRSSGVLMFTSKAVADDKEKIKVMKKVYTSGK